MTNSAPPFLRDGLPSPIHGHLGDCQILTGFRTQLIGPAGIRNTTPNSSSGVVNYSSFFSNSGAQRLNTWELLAAMFSIHAQRSWFVKRMEQTKRNQTGETMKGSEWSLSPSCPGNPTSPLHSLDVQFILQSCNRIAFFSKFFENFCFN